MNATLDLTNVQIAQAGQYYVAVSSFCNTLNSTPVDLIVNELTSITTFPSSQAVCQGQAITLSAQTTGTNNNFQWYFNGNMLNGENSANLSLADFQIIHDGSYSLSVDGTCGNVMSNAIQLNFIAPVNITNQPTAISACQGSTATFSVTANGTNLNYQWFVDGNNVSGANTAVFQTSVLTNPDTNQIYVSVSNVCGTSNSNAVEFIVKAETNIIQETSSLSVCEGSAANFQVIALGSDLQFQWSFDGSDLNGENNPILNLTNVLPSSAGNYTVTVSGACGTLVSVANLNVNSPTSSNLTFVSCGDFNYNGIVYTQSGQYQETLINSAGCDSLVSFDLTIVPLNVEVVLTDNTINATASGLTYQWIDCANNSLVSGATNQSFTPNSTGTYAVIIDNGNCEDTSACVLVEVLAIDENSQSTFSLYPNPTKGKFTLSFNQQVGDYDLEITDISGKIIFAQTKLNTKELALELNQKAGIYFVNLKSASEQITKRIMVE